jgi:hypothetical protein
MDATEDAALRDILRHNRNEEIEHAAMVLEWIRRNSPEFDAKLRPYLFSEGSITEIEDVVEKGNGAGERNGAAAHSGGGAQPYVSIGSLREKR